MARLILATVVLCFIISSALAWNSNPCDTKRCGYGEVCEVRNWCFYPGSCSREAVCVVGTGRRFNNLPRCFSVPPSCYSVARCYSDQDCGPNQRCCSGSQCGNFCETIVFDK